ncbi:hypothetical protein PHYBOEH_004381 [Phytophthora boehmeriae]|uniref:Uncharacterized protein n=1 Tax=Phytophthora boehmeriae TaxID=109152 RepID=A0A8T1WNN6_9STRA|nr:hypothetical protein PHYBOEH_004381 [Phytophthora boehmeriae]
MDTSTTSTFGRDHHQDVRNAKRDYEQLNSPAKSTSSYKDRSSISSMDSRGSPTPRPRPEGIAHTAVGLAPALARKRKADEGGYTGSPLVRSQAQYNGKAPVANGQNVVVKRGPGRPRKYPIDASASIARSGQKVARRKPGRPPKRKYRKRLRRAESSDDDEEADDEDEADDEKMDADGSESELDANLDFCEVCQAAGDLVCCDKCPRSFHLACLHMKESDLPEGDWQCDECKKPSRFEGYSRAVAAEQSLLDKCLKIVACLKSHPFAKPFLSPVENVPMYTRVVKQPMDLSKIEEKLKTGAYIMDTEASVAGVKALNVERFANDIRLMWSNCKLFNDDGSGITRAADQLSRGFERLFRESKQSALDSQG